MLTFKEGLLSPIAHDLRLLVTRFSLHVDDAGGTIEASFDSSSLRVDAPMKDGRENPGALSEADKLQIAAQIRDDVLHSAKFPEVVFRSSVCRPRDDGGYDVQGSLTLHGVTRAISAHTTCVEGRQRLELTLHQPDFGITPFRAMLGTLRIRPDVLVYVELTGS